MYIVVLNAQKYYCDRCGLTLTMLLLQQGALRCYLGLQQLTIQKKLPKMNMINISLSPDRYHIFDKIHIEISNGIAGHIFVFFISLSFFQMMYTLLHGVIIFPCPVQRKIWGNSRAYLLATTLVLICSLTEYDR